MSFTDQKPFEVTEKQVALRWGGQTDGKLSCALCGHRFKPGDVARFVYANGTTGVCCCNFFTCVKCDGPDVLQRGSDDCKRAIEGAKRWGIYGPDWQRGSR